MDIIRRQRFVAILISVLLIGARMMPVQGQSAPIVISGAGDIASTVNSYRTLLGPDNGGDPGSRVTGRREINWDKVPDELAAPNFLPPDFFNNPAAPRARGAVLNTPGQGVQASADSDNPTHAAVRFGNINPSYTDRFKTFSAERLFSPIGSNIVDLTFFVPGTKTPALVRGFGAVYTDVDTNHTAFEYFDKDGKSLGQFAVPLSDKGLSFLGVAFDQPVVAHVRIEYGTVALGPDNSAATDVAVMDDFIFGEPIALDTVAAYKILVPTSVGLLDENGTALYSVMLASGSTDLGKLTVVTEVPSGMTFIEGIATPTGTTFNGFANGKVSWTIDKLPADTILGPFTFRVSLSDQLKSNIPAALDTTVSWAEPDAHSVAAIHSDGSVTGSTASLVVQDRKLGPLAEYGQITIDAKGTGGPAVVNDTGIVVNVPDGAVDKPVTLTFQRSKITDATVVAGGQDIWWCALVQVTADHPVKFAKTIRLLLPSRGTLTPYLPASVFTALPDGTWKQDTSQSAVDDSQSKFGFAYVERGGNHVVISATLLSDLEQPQGKTVLAVGVSRADRDAGKAKGGADFVSQEIGQ